MKKILAKSLLVIIEAGIKVLAERIKKRRAKKGNHDGLDPFRHGGGTYGVRHRSAAHSAAVADRCTTIRSRTRGRSISWERQNTKKGARNHEHKWIS